MGLEKYDAQFIDDVHKLLSRRPAVKEAVVRQSIVLRLLSALGYNIWDMDEVMPEETDLARGRADFIIAKGQGKFIVETKPSDGKFTTKEYVQTINYLVIHGIRYAVMTNGREWIFLDERAGGKPEAREIFKIDIFEDSDYFNRFIPSLLSSEVWENDSFLINSVVFKEESINKKKLEELVGIYYPIAEEFRISNEIGSIEKAVPLAVSLGILPKDASDVILFNRIPKSANDEILFHYENKEISAKSIYNPVSGQWTILAGSTGLSRLSEYGNSGLSSRRKVHAAEGKIIDIGNGKIKFLQDVICTSATIAIQEVLGQQCNGWEYWKDSEGQRASKYKPPGKLRNKKHVPPSEI